MEADLQEILARKKAALLAALQAKQANGDGAPEAAVATAAPLGVENTPNTMLQQETITSIASSELDPKLSVSENPEEGSTALSKAKLKRRKYRENLQLRKQTERDVRMQQEQLHHELEARRQEKLKEIEAEEEGRPTKSESDSIEVVGDQHYQQQTPHQKVKHEDASAGRETEGDKEEEEEEESDEDIMEDEELDEELRGLTRKQRREKLRISIAALKQKAPRPDLVEAHDCNARDPFLLVALKSVPNAVSVPVHWSQKRKYLIAKKSLDKPLFKLPKYIEDTGITQIRNAHLDEAGMTTEKLKKTMRERARPKMNKMDISYETLYNAFFVHAYKPKLTVHGEMYYEGREYDLVTKQFRPGVLSPALRAALGMPEDPAQAAITPPPWLHAMQQHGPPPSYPRLAIPGVNAPLPQGARWGLGANEWGRPPVGMNGRPLWYHPKVSVLDPPFAPGSITATGEPVPKSNLPSTMRTSDGNRLWGVFRPIPIEGEQDWVEPEATEEQDAMVELEEDVAGDQTTVQVGGSSTAPAAAASTGEEELETGGKLDAMTVDSIRRRGTEAGPKRLYTVLEEQAVSTGSGMFGTTHVYVPAGGSSSTGVELSITPEELENMDDAMIKRKYMETVGGRDKSEDGPKRKTEATKLNIF